MKTSLVGMGIVCSLALAGTAAAETPAERVGFQMDIRTGYSIPSGDVAKTIGTNESVKMSDWASGQVPLVVDIGAKVIPMLFVGGYFGFGFGGPAGQLETACNEDGGSCLAVGVRLGAEAQVHFIPAGDVNPWLGYGIGYESLSFSRSGGASSDNDSFTLSGWEYAHFMGGVDFRLSRVVGLGPFVDYSLGQYGSASDGDVSVDIPNTSLHSWLTLGVRVVFFP